MKLIALRRQNNMTQTELAERCGTSQQQIAKIENGVVDPRLSTLRRIAVAFGVELGDLFYTRAEFLEQVTEVAAAHALNLAKITLLDLNLVATADRDLPAFHPFWEQLRIDRAKKRLAFKET